MDSLVIASNELDSEAIETLESTNAEVVAALAARADALLNSENLGQARDELVIWAESKLLPYASLKAEQMASASRDVLTAVALADALANGAEAISDIVAVLRNTDEALLAVGAAQALRAVVELQFENELAHLVPLLASASSVDLAKIVTAAQALTQQAAATVTSSSPEDSHGGHSCGCGESDGEGWPELDARIVPHAIRHATVFGALDAVGPGKGMVLVAPHDPIPLLAQIEQRHPGVFTTEYLERGPEAWKIQFLRQG
jgi:uncharacterized protein (DUF2249 family)